MYIYNIKYIYSIYRNPQTRTQDRFGDKLANLIESLQRIRESNNPDITDILANFQKRPEGTVKETNPCPESKKWRFPNIFVSKSSSSRARIRLNDDCIDVSDLEPDVIPTTTSTTNLEGSKKKKRKRVRFDTVIEEREFTEQNQTSGVQSRFWEIGGLVYFDKSLSVMGMIQKRAKYSVLVTDDGKIIIQRENPLPMDTMDVEIFRISDPGRNDDHLFLQSVTADDLERFQRLGYQEKTKDVLLNA